MQYSISIVSESRVYKSAPYILYEGGSHVLCMGGNVGYCVPKAYMSPLSEWSAVRVCGLCYMRCGECFRLVLGC